MSYSVNGLWSDVMWSDNTTQALKLSAHTCQLHVVAFNRCLVFGWLQGIGAGMVMVTFISNINYNMLLGWSLWYMALSWQAVLPWSVCTHDYNTPCELPICIGITYTSFSRELLLYCILIANSHSHWSRTMDAYLM